MPECLSTSGSYAFPFRGPVIPYLSGKGGAAAGCDRRGRFSFAFPGALQRRIAGTESSPFIHPAAEAARFNRSLNPPLRALCCRTNVASPGSPHRPVFRNVPKGIYGVVLKSIRRDANYGVPTKTILINHSYHYTVIGSSSSRLLCPGKCQRNA